MSAWSHLIALSIRLSSITSSSRLFPSKTAFLSASAQLSAFSSHSLLNSFLGSSELRFGYFRINFLISLIPFIFSSLIGAFVGRLAALIAAAFNYVNVSLIEKFAKYAVVFYGVYYAINKLNILPNNQDFTFEKAVIYGAALAIALGSQRWAGETFQNLFEQDSDNDALPPTKLKKK